MTWKAEETFEEFVQRELKENAEELKLFLWLKQLKPLLQKLPDTPHDQAIDSFLNKLSSNYHSMATMMLRDYLKQWKKEEIPSELIKLAYFVELPTG